MAGLWEKLPDLAGGALKLVEGEEKRLRLRQRNARRFGVLGLVGGLAIEVGVFLIKGDYQKNVSDIGQFVGNLVQLRFDKLFTGSTDYLVGLLVIFAGLTVFVLLRWTGFLMRESQEPFRYTFDIGTFERVADTPAPDRFKLKNEDQFKLLSHDLKERLSQRIRRLSYLDLESPQSNAEGLVSHIHIEGHYAIRQEDSTRWVIQVMPLIRIGSPERPSTLAPPIKYPLALDDSKVTEVALEADAYNQIVERVYSHIATEVYRQIETDVRGKIPMFPTAYLRAVALGYEAEDFARSNTIDGYDRAIDLYRDAVRFFAVADVPGITDGLLRLPIVWRKEAHFINTQARVVTGYAEALIYRRILSALTGRYRNPLFEIPPLLTPIVSRLRLIHSRVAGTDVRERGAAARAFLTFPEDWWWQHFRWRPSVRVFERQQRALFDTLVTTALGYYYLDAVNQAAGYLEDARAVDPRRSKQDPLYLLTEAEIEPSLDREIPLFQRAAELAPDFQIANYLYAFHLEKLFRARDELTPERARRVICAYDDVMGINPGNTAALAAQGYIQWLVKKGDEARRCFERGRDVKAVIRETYVGVLNYGLARIAAEDGRFNECYELYTEAVTVDPGVAAYSVDSRSASNGTYYEYITPAILQRYQNYREQVLKRLDAAPGGSDDATGEPCSQRTKDTVRSFVLNDCGNACLNYYVRLGDDTELARAIENYQKAVEADKTNAVAFYNLAFAQSYAEADPTSVAENLEKAERLAPSWPIIVTACARAHMDAINRTIQATDRKYQETTARIKELEEGAKPRSDAERPSGASWQYLPTQPKGAPQNRGSGESPMPTDVEGVPRKRDEENQARKREEELARKRKEQEDLKSALDEQRHLISAAVMDRLRRALLATRFGPLLATPLKDNIVAAVQELVSIQIEPSRLDENDIDTVKVWASVLSKSREAQEGPESEEESAATAAEELCRFVGNYYPEDFDRNVLRYDISTAPNQAAARQAAAHELAVTARRWTEMDPVHYMALTWVVYDNRPDFRDEERLGLMQQAIAATDLAGDDTSIYHVLAGDYYYNRGLDVEAIEEYTRATMRWPNRAAWANRLGNAYIRVNRAEDAVRSYEVATHAPGESKELGVYRRNLGLAFNAWGNSLSSEDRHREAIEKYRLAVECIPDDAVIYSNLSDSWKQLREPGRRVEALEEAVSAMKKAVEHAEKPGRYEEQLKLLKLSRQAGAKLGEQVLDRMPLTTPIAMEIAGNLVPFVEGASPGTLAPLMEQLTVSMRQRIERETGVPMPGLRYRGNEADLPDGSYILMLNEIPVATGHIATDRRFCDGPLALLERLGTAGEAARLPESAQEGHWVSQPAWQRLLGAGGSLWEVMEYPVRHLEGILRRNLKLFMGHQEVVLLLEKEDSPAARDLLKDPERLSQLTAVLRALVSEQVPIVEFRSIVEFFAGHPTIPLDELVAEVRLLPAIRSRLPGATPGRTLRRVGERLATRLLKALLPQDGHQVLALEPEFCQQALAAVREENGTEAGALVVQDRALRPFVRKLVELEFPALSVITAEELGASAERLQLMNEVEIT